MKELLITMPKVQILQEFITQAITCNNRFFERRQKKQFGWRNANHTMVSTSSVLEKMHNSWNPCRLMQLNISYQLKEKRFDVVENGYAFIVGV